MRREASTLPVSAFIVSEAASTEASAAVIEFCAVSFASPSAVSFALEALMSAASAVSVISPFVALISASLTDRSPEFAVAVRAPAVSTALSSVTELPASTDA